MRYYKATVEIAVGKNKDKPKTNERVLYIKGENITHAMDIVRKVRSARWDAIREITWNAYVNGVQNN